MNESIYLDYNATTPIDPQVANAMIPFLYNKFGNPSSTHEYGIIAKQAIEAARTQVAEMLKCNTEEIVFTSGGTESNNFAIKGIANALKNKGKHIITSEIEHPSVLEVCKYLERQGFDFTYLPVDQYGTVDLKMLENAITSETILITIMHANNEVGTIEPIENISEIAKKYNIIFHTDCAQSIGKIPVYTDNLNADLLSIAGHKLYGPKGVGALYIRSGIEIEKTAFGANHEMNRRAGTENVFSIVGLGKACELVTNNLSLYSKKMKGFRDYLESQLQNSCSDIKINGNPESRLPNTLSVGFKNIEANQFISKIPEIAVSPGAACHSDKIDISHVLNAMNVPLEYAMGTLRFSVGRDTTYEEINTAVKIISKVLSDYQTAKKWYEVNKNEDELKLTKYSHGLGCACKIGQGQLQQILKKDILP